MICFTKKLTSIDAFLFFLLLLSRQERKCASRSSGSLKTKDQQETQGEYQNPTPRPKNKSRPSSSIHQRSSSIPKASHQKPTSANTVFSFSVRGKTALANVQLWSLFTMSLTGKITWILLIAVFRTFYSGFYGFRGCLSFDQGALYILTSWNS